MNECYHLNKDIFTDEEKLNLLAEYGFDISIEADGEMRLYIITPLSLDHEIVRGSLDNIYTNQDWINTHYKKHKSVFRKYLGLRYNMDGKPTMSAKFKDVLCNWSLNVLDPLGEGLLAVTSGDPFEHNYFINKSNILEVAPNIIQDLLDLHYIVESTY